MVTIPSIFFCKMATIDPYTNTRTTELFLKEIDINSELESDSVEYQLGFSYRSLDLI